MYIECEIHEKRNNIELYSCKYRDKDRTAFCCLATSRANSTARLTIFVSKQLMPISNSVSLLWDTSSLKLQLPRVPTDSLKITNYDYTITKYLKSYVFLFCRCKYELILTSCTVA